MRNILGLMVVTLSITACASMQPITCDGKLGFSAGLAESQPASTCRKDPAYQEGYQVGSSIAHYQDRVQNTTQALAAMEQNNAPQSLVGKTRRELIRFTGELEALQGLAIVKGWAEQSHQLPQE